MSTDRLTLDEFDASCVKLTARLLQQRPPKQVTGRFAYIEVVSPTRPKSFRLHDLSRFAYIEVDSLTLNS